ncbi:MAG: hypothetical protein WC516_06750 [Patescibacteria group bacterium]|jgi:seryl-tRNA synthetase
MKVTTVEDVTKVKAKMAKLKAKSDKAQGVIESIQKKFKDEYKLDDVKAVKLEIDTLDKKIEKRKERMSVVCEKIEKVYDWESV